MAEADVTLRSRLGAAFPGLDYMSWALVDQCVVSGATFLTTVLVARMLDAADFGRFVLCLTAVLLVQLIQNALITAPMLNLAAKQPEEQRARYGGAVMLQQALFSLLTSGAVWLLLMASDGFRPEWQLAGSASAVAVLIGVGQVGDFVRRYCFAVGRASAAFAVDFVRYGGQVIVLGAMLLEPPGSLNNVLIVMTLCSLAGSIVAYWLLEPVAFCWHTFTSVSRRHWRFSRWLLGSFTLEWLQENFLVVLVGAAVGLVDVGAYRAAQQLVNVTNVPMLAFSHVLPNRAASAYAQGGSRGLEAFVRATVLRYLAPFALIVALIGLFGEPLLTFIYGQRFAGQGYIVTAFAAILLAQIMREVVTVMNRAMENTAPEFLAQLVGCAVVLASGASLVTAYGITGALVCAGLYGLTVLCILVASYWRHRRG